MPNNIMIEKYVQSDGIIKYIAWGFNEDNSIIYIDSDMDREELIKKLN